MINEALVGAVRLLNGRDPEPTAGIIDSQLVKTSESGYSGAAVSDAVKVFGGPDIKIVRRPKLGGRAHLRMAQANKW